MSDHSIPSPMHLRLGHKDRVWGGEFADDEEEDGIGRIKAIGEDEEDNLDAEDEGEFEGEAWDDNEQEEEEENELEDEVDQEEVEWDIPDFPSKYTQHHNSQHQHYGPQKAEASDATETIVSQAVTGGFSRSHLSRYRSLRRLWRFKRLRSNGELGFRLSQHWKSWRQRAQWVYSQRHRWSLRGQRCNLYGKHRRIRRYRQSPYSDGENHSNEERFTEPDRGTALTTTITTRFSSGAFIGIIFKYMEE